MIRPSAGTCAVLGLEKIKMETPPTCAYFMIGEKCPGRCLFCAQSSLSKQGDLLSRVTWKKKDPERVYRETFRCYEEGSLQRACFQVTGGGRSFERVLGSVEELKKTCNIPVCVSIHGIDTDRMEELFQAGVERIAISFDAATPDVFEKVKGYPWQDLWKVYIRAAKRFPHKIVVHLIVGLGETGEEMVEAIKTFYRYGTPVSLFAFTPLWGTPMKNHPPPSLASYRRIQIAHYIVRNRQDFKSNDIHFSEKCFGYKDGEVEFHKDYHNFLRENIPGEAFMTYGCPGCNRPNYNEKPGRVPYNYPRPLSEKERVEAINAALDREGMQKESS